MSDEPNKAVAIIGNLSDGFQVAGPFDSWDEAAAAADGFDSWITELHPTAEQAEAALYGDI